MKKIITLIMAVCMMASVMGISALAADYTGPETHQIPGIVDFETEVAKQYYGATAQPKTFYNLASFNFVAADGVTGNKFLDMRPGSNVAGKVAVKFSDFVYDETAVDGIQPEKLVISFDARYSLINYTSKNSGNFGTYDHIVLGTATDDLGIQSGGVTNAIAKFYYTFNEDNEMNSINYHLGSSWHGLAATAMNNHSYKSALTNGEWVKYTFVIDLTRDSNGACSITWYINDAKYGPVPYEGSTPIAKLNALSIATGKDNEMEVDNIRAYTIPKEKIAVVGQDLPETDAPITADGVVIDFNHEINDGAEGYISVYKNEAELIKGVDYTIEPIEGTTGAKTVKSMKIKFTEEPLSYLSTYTVKASAEYYGADEIPVGEEMTLASFTTQAPPQILLSDLSIKKGFLAETPVTSLSDVLGSTVTVQATVTNGEVSGEATGLVFFGVYKNGSLVSVAYVNKTFDQAETETISVKLKMPQATSSDTVEVKAFACESIFNISPFATPIQVSTAD